MAGMLNTSVLAELPTVKAAMGGYIHASVAASTWSRYRTGWRVFEEFQTRAKKEFTWPLDDETIQGFVGYCLAERKLKPSSIKTYLSSLVKLHKLKGYKNYTIDRETVTAVTRGATYLMLTGPQPPTNKRRVMTLQILRLLGHQLANSGWSDNTQQTIWAACLTGFFSSARMGELLAPCETGLDPTATLTWKCLQFRDDGSVLIHIRLPKMMTQEGDFVDLFPFPDPPYCPVAALERMYWQQKAAGLGRPETAVFTYATGKQLTRDGLNAALKTLLEPLFDFSQGSISCHSFRAALPSALAARPHQVSAEDIKHWGRWSSDTYQSYTRLKQDQKRELYKKIVSTLMDIDNSYQEGQ
jgi:site-specific recombinase XerD